MSTENKEVQMNEIRVEKGLSYAEATKRIRNDEMVGVQKEPGQRRSGADQNICMEKKRGVQHSLP